MGFRVFFSVFYWRVLRVFLAKLYFFIAYIFWHKNSHIKETAFAPTLQKYLALKTHIVFFHHIRCVTTSDVLSCFQKYYQRVVGCFRLHVVFLTFLRSDFYLLMCHTKFDLTLLAGRGGKTLPWPNISVAQGHSLLSYWLTTRGSLVFRDGPNLAGV